MAHSLSAEQLRAINERGGNILVAAGAGSGKTTVLAERVLSLVCGDEPKDIDRLLVLTFTNAAAAEMRSRIEENLAQRLEAQAGDVHLIRQLALVQQAPITTIHAFCLDTVRRHFYHLGLDAGFGIPSDMERAILRQETLTAFLETEYEKNDKVLATLADCYGGRRDDAALARLIDELYSFSRSQPYPEAWLREGAAAFKSSDSLQGYAWSDFLLQELRQELALAQRYFEQARDRASHSLEAKGQKTEIGIPSSWLVHIEQEIDALGETLACGGGLAGFCRALSAINFTALPRAAQEGAEEAKEEFRRLRDAGKSAAYELKEHFGQRAPQDMLADLRALAPLMEGLCDLVINYGAALATEKRRRNLLDFDDMEHFCLHLLEDNENGVADTMRKQFDELLIDEYQDINAVQERILTLLSQGDNIFAVGDVKQSIYRFRLAEPALFLHKFREYKEGRGGIRIDLNRNYRSSKGIVASVNYLCAQLMSMKSSELVYDESAKLKAGQEDFGAKSELWLVDRSATPLDPEDLYTDAQENSPADIQENSPADTLEDPPAEMLVEQPVVLEARLLGRRIQALQKEGYDLRDIAVLLRAAKNRENLLVREFADMGIAAVAGSRPDYLQTAEVSLVLALLGIIDNPLQELELAAVLRSPLYGFSLDELAQIRWTAPNEQLYNALTAAAQAQGELALKCRLFIEQLTDWRESLRRRRISELIGAVYAETGLLQLAGALPRGAQRQENLLLLKERAREYETGSYRGLFRFLLFLADGRGKSVREGVELAEGEDAVRVMSIHRSKGLEFPVVIIANLGAAFALLDESRDIVWHKELGLGPKVVEREQRRKFPSLAQEAIARRLHKEALAEEMRVLYVALTRARAKLILSGVVKDAGQSAAAWYRQIAGQGPVLAGELLLQDKRPLDWLGQALMRHPQAIKLRQAAGISSGSAEERQLLIPDSSEWQINIVPESELRASDESKTAQKTPMPSLDDTERHSPYKQAVAAALSYQYPYRAACGAAAKWTVTELIKRPEARRQKPEECRGGLPCPPADRINKNLTVANPADANPTDANPTDANPTDANPTVTNPADANPTVANPADANPTDANPADANFTGANPADANLTVANLADANLTVANPTDANPTVANPTDANPTDANPTGANPTDAQYAPLHGAIPRIVGRGLDFAAPRSLFAADHSPQASARRGTAQHKFLQNLDFTAGVTAEGVRLQLSSLMEQGRLTAEEASLVEPEKIARFAASQLGRRMAASTRTFREMPFTYALPAQEITPNAAPQDKLVLQGIIDAAFWEEGGWVLLDYKTGGVGLLERQLKETYAAQLLYYSRALRDIWQEPVQEAWLCFVDLEKNICI